MSKHTIKFIQRAHTIRASLGVRRAAGYLRNRHVSLEDALLVLVGRR